jgi:hypothetical protein
MTRSTESGFKEQAVVADVSDEMLMAFADGMLDAATRESVEAEILRNPEYAQKVEKFRATSELIRKSFRHQPTESALELLAEGIAREDRPSGVTQAARNGSRGIRFSGRARPRANASSQPWPLAMAASIALLVGGAAGWLLYRGGTESPQTSAGLVSFESGRLVAHSALQELLEKKASGTPSAAKTTDGRSWELKASFTFRSTDQLTCRRYEMSSNDAGRFAGFACRSGAGLWTVQAHAQQDVQPGVDGKTFAPAAGGSSALDAAIRAAMEGDALEPAEEAALLASRWAATRK